MRPSLLPTTFGLTLLPSCGVSFLATCGSGRGSLLVALLVVALSASPALAQSTYGGQSAAEADGFRISDTGRVHVFSNLDLRYDTNPGLLSPGHEVADMSLRVRGGLRLLQPSERLEIATGLSVDWTQFFGLVNSATRGFSALQGIADVSLIANKNGAVSGYLTDSLARAESATEISLSQRLKSWRNSARIGVDIRPGGRALEFGVSYGFDLSWYDANQAVVVNSQALSAYSHLIHAQGLWHFFPKTAATLEIDEQITRYPNANSGGGVTATGISTNVPEVDTNPFKIRVGLVGLLTEKLIVRLNAGYANTFTSGANAAASSNEQTVIGTAQLTFKPTELITFAGGFIRDVSPVTLYAYFDYDRVFLEYQHFLFARFILALRATYEYETFGKSPFAGLAARHDNVVRGEARFSYQARRWLTASIYYLPEARLTDFKSVVGIPGTYIRHAVGVDVTFGY